MGNILEHRQENPLTTMFFFWNGCFEERYSYGHLPVITGYFYGIIHSINGVLLVLITDFYGHNCVPNQLQCIDPPVGFSSFTGRPLSDT